MYEYCEIFAKQVVKYIMWRMGKVFFLCGYYGSSVCLEFTCSFFSEGRDKEADITLCPRTGWGEAVRPLLLKHIEAKQQAALLEGCENQHDRPLSLTTGLSVPLSLSFSRSQC